MKITRTGFDLGMHTRTEETVTLDSARLEIGSCVISDLPVTTDSVTYPDDDRTTFTLITAATPSGRVLVMWIIEQPVSRYATGIPG